MQLYEVGLTHRRASDGEDHSRANGVT